MIAIFFIFGLIMGSFLNVIVYRINIAENILGRSHCPTCKKTIRWYDNIPLLSFVLLRAKCRDCQESISWQYPLVEFFTGLLFMLAGWHYFVPSDSSTWPMTAYFLGIISFLIVIFAYDYLFMEIPGLMLWIGIFWTVAFNLYFDWINQGKLGDAGMLGGFVYSGVLAGVGAFIFFFLLVLVSREKWMGMGDAYLAIFLGLILGWPKILLALFLAFSIGAICGIILIALKKKELGSQVPFAPFLAFGTIITMFFYEPVISWYLKLFIY
jgi:leader peptidase (prepilin peptidase)/N-methyltransferase